jgi:hypothetical protein
VRPEAHAICPPRSRKRAADVPSHCRDHGSGYAERYRLSTAHPGGGHGCSGGDFDELSGGYDPAFFGRHSIERRRRRRTFVGHVPDGGPCERDCAFHRRRDAAPTGGANPRGRAGRGRWTRLALDGIPRGRARALDGVRRERGRLDPAARCARPRRPRARARERARRGDRSRAPRGRLRVPSCTHRTRGARRSRGEGPRQPCDTTTGRQPLTTARFASAPRVHRPSRGGARARARDASGDPPPRP